MISFAAKLFIEQLSNIEGGTKTGRDPELSQLTFTLFHDCRL